MDGGGVMLIKLLICGLINDGQCLGITKDSVDFEMVDKMEKKSVI